MERPDIGKTPIERPGEPRLVATTQSIEEAERISQQYEMQGYRTQIVKKGRAGISLYEVWISKEPEIFSGQR